MPPKCNFTEYGNKTNIYCTVLSMMLNHAVRQEFFCSGHPLFTPPGTGANRYGKVRNATVPVWGCAYIISLPSSFIRWESD